MSSLASRNMIKLSFAGLIPYSGMYATQGIFFTDGSNDSEIEESPWSTFMSLVMYTPLAILTIRR